MSGLLFIISAPSGSGKSTLVNEVRNSVPGLEFSVSYTTRKPRGSELNGREYYYVDKEQFQRMIDRKEFLEYADVFGNYYGTARRFLDDAMSRGNDLLLDIDVQGAELVQQKMKDAISIFILPPSRKELEARLTRRSSAENMKDKEVIERRLRTATSEIEKYCNYSYILVNDRLEESIDCLKAIILHERHKRSGAVSTIEDEEHKALAEKCLLENTQDRAESIRQAFLVDAQNVAQSL
jgi:guanylate kinase